MGQDPTRKVGDNMGRRPKEIDKNNLKVFAACNVPMTKSALGSALRIKHLIVGVSERMVKIFPRYSKKKGPWQNFVASGTMGAS